MTHSLSSQSSSALNPSSLFGLLTFNGSYFNIWHKQQDNEGGCGSDDDSHITVGTLCICFIFPGHNCLEGKDNFIYTFWNPSQNLGSTVCLVGIQ